MLLICPLLVDLVLGDSVDDGRGIRSHLTLDFWVRFLNHCGEAATTVLETQIELFSRAELT